MNINTKNYWKKWYITLEYFCWRYVVIHNLNIFGKFYHLNILNIVIWGYVFGDIIIIYDGSYRSKDQQQGVVWAGVRTLPLHSLLGGAVLHPLSKLHWFSRRRRRVSPRFAPIVTVTPISPYYAISGQRFTFPDRHSEVQYLINLGRYTNIHSDVIWSASYQSTFLFKAIT